jgi:hypothetical protein
MKKNSRNTPKKSPQLPRFGPPGLRFPALEGGGHVTYSVPLAAEVTASSARSVNRWRRDGRIPARPLLLLQLHHAGWIMPPAWRRRGAGFNVAGDLVVGAYVFRVGELEGYGVMLDALRTLSQERARRGPEEPVLPLLTVIRGGRA